jgi:hypothetical protein
MMRMLLYFYVCISNLYGLRILSVETEPVLRLFVWCAVLSSFAQHVYELERFTAKNLNIRTLKQDTLYRYLTLMDKVSAWSLMALYMYFKYSVIIESYRIQSIAAVLLCVLSTELTKDNTVAYAVLHGSWHLAAFHLGYLFSLGDILR